MRAWYHGAVLHGLPENYPHFCLLDEFDANETAEEKLAWLMERKTPSSTLPDSEMTPENRIPGCQSGLWLNASVQGGVTSYLARSDSAMVQGVVCFLCDLCSGVAPGEVSGIARSIEAGLGLEGLLTTTRKRAVATALARITDFANRAQ